MSTDNADDRATCCTCSVREGRKGFGKDPAQCGVHGDDRATAEVPGLSEAEREALREAYHDRQSWEYGECDHGTYSGGPSNGEPYAMCERWAGSDTCITAAVERILAARTADLTRELAEADAALAGLVAAIEGLHRSAGRGDRRDGHCDMICRRHCAALAADHGPALAARDAGIKAGAWDEGWEYGGAVGDRPKSHNPYRADQIAGQP